MNNTILDILLQKLNLDENVLTSLRAVINESLEEEEVDNRRGLISSLLYLYVMEELELQHLCEEYIRQFANCSDEEFECYGS